MNCFDCEKAAARFYKYDGKSICGPCTGWRDELAMRKSNEMRLYYFNGQLHNAARSFHLDAIIKKANRDTFPEINQINTVFDASVWTGVISSDNIDGAVLMKRTKKKFMPNGEEI